LRHLRISTSWLEVPIIEVKVLLNQLCWSNEVNYFGRWRIQMTGWIPDVFIGDL